MITEIYDGYNFDPTKIVPLEEGLMEMIQGQDLSQQFLKGFFLYLLAYAGYNEKLIELSKNQSNLVNYYEALHKKYKNIEKMENKIHSLQTIRRMAKNGYIDINEMVNYNCESLMGAYVENLHGVILAVPEQGLCKKMCEQVLAELF